MTVHTYSYNSTNHSLRYTTQQDESLMDIKDVYYRTAYTSCI